MIKCFLISMASFFAASLFAQPLVHPGILHSKANLDSMKAAVSAKRGPTWAGYQKFIENSASAYAYQMKGPLAMVGRNPTTGQREYDEDANAAHQNAVMWAITSDQRHADKAIEIINAWTGSLTSITGKDAVLMAGLGPFKMVNAAEIIRYTNAGWQPAAIAKAEQHFKTVMYPILKDFAPFANGNWDAAAIKTVMAIGVFCNDREIFEKALRYYVQGGGNGSLLHYVINEAGQIQESGRDQPHSQLGIGMLAESCAIAWNQGLDLYGLFNNRLLAGFEYTAKYNLGHDDMPFTEWLDRTGKYHHTAISDKGRNQLRAVYEQVCNHYVTFKKLSAPYLQAAVDKLRPEGPGMPGADHPGYGTLFFTSMPVLNKAAPVSPAGLIATGNASIIQLSWVSVSNANDYTVRRALKKDGPYTTIATQLTTNNYEDKQISKGKQYYYRITANNEAGESPASFTQAAMAGLPAGWQQATVGNADVGSANWDGNQLTIEASGNGMDSYHYVYFAANGNGVLTVRLLPQPSSQFSVMGLVCKTDTAVSSPSVSFMIYPGKTGQIEAPDWHTRLLQQKQPDTTPALIDTVHSLTPPAVTYGRLTGTVWLRMEKKADNINCWYSYDGKNWVSSGQTFIVSGNKALLGIAVGSGMPNSTTVLFDDIKWTLTK